MATYGELIVAGVAIALVLTEFKIGTISGLPVGKNGVAVTTLLGVASLAMLALG